MDMIWKGSIKQKLMRISMLTTCVALLLTSILLIANEVITFRQSLIERMGDDGENYRDEQHRRPDVQR